MSIDSCWQLLKVMGWSTSLTWKYILYFHLSTFVQRPLEVMTVLEKITYDLWTYSRWGITVAMKLQFECLVTGMHLWLHDCHLWPSQKASDKQSQRGNLKEVASCSHMMLHLIPAGTDILSWVWSCDVSLNDLITYDRVAGPNYVW